MTTTRNCLECCSHFVSVLLRGKSVAALIFFIYFLAVSCTEKDSWPVPLDTPRWYQINVDASAGDSMTVSWPALEGAGGYEFTLFIPYNVVALYDSIGNFIKNDTIQEEYIINKKVVPENFIVCPQRPNTIYRMILNALGDHKTRSNGQMEMILDWNNFPAQTPNDFTLIIDSDSDPDSIAFSWLNVPKSIGVIFALYTVDENKENPVLVGEIDTLSSTVPDSIDIWGNLIRGRTTVKRPQAPGTYFKVVLQALANPNPKFNTKNGIVKTIFTDNFPGALIPNGANLTDYFTLNPPKGDVLSTYSLVNGGRYIMTGDIRFGASPVKIRSEYSEPDNPRAKITVTGGSFKSGGAELLFENVEFDYTSWAPVAGGTGVGNAVIMMDDVFNPTGKTLGSTGSGTGYLFISPEQPIGFKSTKITGLKGHLFLNNNLKYAIGYFIIDDCEIQLNTNTFEKALIFFNGAGLIKNLLFRNSTLYNLQTPAAALAGHPYLIQFTNTTRVPEAIPPSYLADEWLAPVNGVYNETTQGKAAGTIISGCTFWQMGKYNQSFNSNGPLRRADDVIFVEKCIFVDCWEDGSVFRRFGIGGNIKTEYAFTTGTRSSLGTNTEWFNGVFSNKNTYDTNQQMINANPGFTDPANGNFKPTGPEIIAAGIGDPRWLK